MFRACGTPFLRRFAGLFQNITFSAHHMVTASHGSGIAWFSQAPGRQKQIHARFFLGNGNASRENDHALALAEQTRDLAALMQQLGREGQMRDLLAALPGPVQRPDHPGAVLMVEDADPLQREAQHLAWILPVAGRVTTGFGEQGTTGAAQGLTIAPVPSAQIIAPAAGRVAFAGPYRGYGQIVIVEHDGGWTSLITGMGRIDVGVGDKVVQGSPLGIAAPARPQVTVELRKDGAPINPLGVLHG